MEVICIDGKFSADQLAFYVKHGVTTPKEESIYNIREVIKHTNGDVGVLLEEIVNPKVPTKHPILGVIDMEPTWRYTRFSDLQGNILTAEQVKELIHSKTKSNV